MSAVANTLACAAILAAGVARAGVWSTSSGEFEADLSINAASQHVLVRGREHAPLLFFIHGGPGANENPLVRQFLPELERHYQVVYWEQRGTGRSFSGDLPDSTMTITQFVRDLEVLVETLATRYGQQKVYVFAHSWGTIPAALYAQANPSRVAAYIGVSQMTDVPASELEGWSWALKQARGSKHRRAIAELERIGPPPHNVDEMLLSRRWVERFGGTFHGPLRTRDLLLAAFKDDHVGLRDLVLFGKGNRYSLAKLWPEIRSFRLNEEMYWDTPVVLMSGEYDRVTSANEARTFYHALRARCKRFVSFQLSAHNPLFEQPQPLSKWMTRTLIPWSRSCDQAKSP